MAAFLYRVGRLAFRRRWYVALMWVGVLAVVGFGAARAPAAPDAGFSIPGTESQQASDLIQQRFPGASASGAIAQIVFVAPHGQQVTAIGDRAAIEQVMAEVAGGPQVASVLSPFQGHAVSRDATTAYATVTYKVAAAHLTDATKTTLRDAVQHARAAGLTVEVGGNALTAQPAVGGATEVVGIAVAAVVLLVTFGSLAAAGLPLLIAAISVGVGVASIIALGSALGLSTTTTTLATMLGLAVGIDYAVFIVSRYREERARGHAPQEAAGLAVGTAGSSVVFAGLTVVIGLAGLSVVGVPMLTKMGLAAAGTVVVAVLVALTLVPALLGIFPRAVLPRAARRKAKAAHADKLNGGKPNGGTRWARLVLRHPVPVLLLAVVGLATIAVPVLSLHLGTQGAESKPASTTERRAYDHLARAFGPGFNGPLTIVVDAKGAADPKTAVPAITRAIGTTAGVVSVSAARFDPAGDIAVFSAVPATAPTDRKTADLVHAIRAERPGLTSTTGATFMVSGATAINIDSAQKVQDSLLPYLAVVVSLAFLLLLVVFRSVLVPLKAALGFLLSVLAALGAVVAVFQRGWLAGLLGVHQTGPIMSMMPIFMVGIIFGLAMDYEVFLVTRVREAYVHGERPGQAVVSGFRSSARVVVAAALIMTAVFSGFIGAGDPLIKMIGFGMATAVLFDAFVVRMTIVPAALALLGDRAWWLPRWLNRALPRMDIEGEALAGRSAAVAAAEGAADQEAVELTRAHHPDVVVMDIRMPGTDGLTATAAICGDQDLSATRVLILTTFELDEYVAQALFAGASGFLGKDVKADELLADIRTVAAGDALLSPLATRALITRFLSTPQPGTHLPPPELLAALTAREREVMALAAEGQSNHEIAEKLVVSPLTARTHIQRAMTKLNARDRAQLVVIAYQSGLVRPVPPPRASP